MWVLFAAGCMLGSCAGPTRMTHDRDDRDDVESYRSEATVHGSRAKAGLETARVEAMRGDYADAEEGFLEVYRSGSAEPKYKAEALLSLGDLYRNPLNPHHDPGVASSYYAKLIEEFPESELRAEAEQGVRETGAPAAPDTTAPR